MEDHEMLEKILNSAQKIKVPAALEPKQVKKMLQNERVVCQGRFAARRRRCKMIAAAACLCLCFGAGGAAYQNYARQASEMFEQKEDFPATEADRDAAQDGEIKKVPATGDATTEDAVEHVSESKEGAEDMDTAENEPVKKLGNMYLLASDYGEVYDVLKKDTERTMTQKQSSIKNDGLKQEVDVGESPVSENASVKDLAADASDESREMEDAAGADLSDSSIEYSTTNLQVEGVDESDCVKTDGKFLYVVQDAQIQVLDVREQIPKKAGTIQPDLDEDTDRICEMYVADGILTVIVQTEQTSLQQGTDSIYADLQQLTTKAATKAVTYDIANPEKPVYMDTVTQDGWFQESRKIANHLYLFTRQSLQVADGLQREEILKGEGLRSLLPSVNNKVVPVDCIYLPQEGSQGLLMASIDLAGNNKVLDTKLLIHHDAKLYVSSRSVYLYYNDYVNGAVRTRIARFALTADGSIQAKAAKTVKGSIEDTFAIHEREGYLQVLTSVTHADPWENRVYVLDENMQVAGKLTGLAKGEKIYAARFAGTMGYFVTYRNTDPLFTVDFKDPCNPKVVGELKVTGFSEYLHFWSDDRLLGIGYETDPDSGMTIGMKLSMFDISNPAKVKEEAKLVLKGVIECDGLFDYKAVLVHPKKNIIAFTTKNYDEKFEEHYRVFSFENGKFVRRVEHTLHSGEEAFPDSRWRSVFVNTMLYLVNERKVFTFDLADGWKNVAKLKFE